jgi:hypothetical protein
MAGKGRPLKTDDNCVGPHHYAALPDAGSGPAWTIQSKRCLRVRTCRGQKTALLADRLLYLLNVDSCFCLIEFHVFSCVFAIYHLLLMTSHPYS